MNHEQMLAHLRTSNDIAREAMAHGHHPFGAVLVAADDRVLMRQGNLDALRHAESELCRRAAATYEPEFLWTCTLVTNFEPCAMCAGAIYWANIGRLVYGVAEEKLLALTGEDPQNPTMHLPARFVLGSGQKPIDIHGPFPELEAELLATHAGFWRQPAG